MPYFILFSRYINSTRSTWGLGRFFPILFQVRAQRDEAGIMSMSEKCLQPHHKAWKWFSPGIQKHLLPAQKDGVKDLLPSPPWMWTLWYPTFFPPFLHHPRDVTGPENSWPFYLLCLPQQQVKLQCQLSRTTLPVNWVMLQVPFPVIRPKEIYADWSANLSRRHIFCICLSASKQAELLHLDDAAAKVTPQRQMG